MKKSKKTFICELSDRENMRHRIFQHTKVKSHINRLVSPIITFTTTENVRIDMRQTDNNIQHLIFIAP